MKTLIWLWRVYWCDWTKELSDEPGPNGEPSPRAEMQAYSV
jgi:hypothetical protein